MMIWRRSADQCCTPTIASFDESLSGERQGRVPSSFLPTLLLSLIGAVLLPSMFQTSYTSYWRKIPSSMCPGRAAARCALASEPRSFLFFRGGETWPLPSLRCPPSDYQESLLHLFFANSDQKTCLTLGAPVSHHLFSGVTRLRCLSSCALRPSSCLCASCF